VRSVGAAVGLLGESEDVDNADLADRLGDEVRLVPGLYIVLGQIDLVIEYSGRSAELPTARNITPERAI
jgi:hypothetical protein